MNMDAPRRTGDSSGLVAGRHRALAPFTNPFTPWSPFLLAATSVLAMPVAGAADPAPPSINPVIAEYGAVVPLPGAAAQPRDGSKICVDLTAGGDRERLNPAIEKLARYVNLYAGAGTSPATVEIAVVIHGEATLDILDDAAYATAFGVTGNPNVECLRRLKAAGVRFLVCGQSLHGKGADPRQIASIDGEPVAELAVSALTAIVNRQADGYAMVPLH